MSLEEEMRAFEHGHSDARFAPLDDLEAGCAHKAILFRLEVQNGRSDLTKFHPDITQKHCPQSRGQHLRSDGGDYEPHRRH